MDDFLSPKNSRVTAQSGHISALYPTGLGHQRVPKEFPVKDPQALAFNKRLKRINRIHRRGGGFEAEGTLGQSFYTRRNRSRSRSILRPTVLMLGAMIVGKAVLHANLGSDEYLRRVSDLADGSTVERAGAFLMAADPVTLTVAEWVAPLFGA